jgi:hypothetical protein
VPVTRLASHGMDGAFCHLKGRNDFPPIFAVELALGKKSPPLRHIYGKLICLMSGHGAAPMTPMPPANTVLNAAIRVRSRIR